MKTTPFASAACGLVTAGLLFGSMSVSAEEKACAANPFVGRWALNLPHGGAGWLGVERLPCGALKGSLLWGGGSVMPVAETKIEDQALVVVRKHNAKKDGKDVQNTETITAKLDGDTLALATRTVNCDGQEIGKAEFTGKRIPDLPPRPDLSKLKFGAPVPLLNGKELTGWKAMNEKAPNCWSVADGMLSNRVMGPDGKNRHGTNIRTEAEFEDFNLKTEVRVPKNGNSGIYLRGLYEVEVEDAIDPEPKSTGLGGIYGFLVPNENASAGAGNWQTFDITLVGRRVTVVLNGKTIIGDQTIPGITGGALDSDEGAPGPIYLQGDHGAVSYRNLRITPAVPVK